MDLEAFARAACVAVEAIVGTIPTILIIALLFGLVALSAALTVLVLWRYLSLGAQYTILQCWRKAEIRLRSTAEWYFNRLKWYGLRKVTCKIAVLCSVVVYLSILAGFAFHTHWRESAIFTAIVLMGFFIAGWLHKGEAARSAPLRFARGFYEPTLVIGIPTILTKCVDLGIKAMAGSF